MKKLLLLLAIILSINVSAQYNVKFDSSAAIAYVNIDPVAWVRKESPASRLYVGIGNYQLTYSITIFWQVRGIIQIDANTINTVVLTSGQYQIAGAEFAKWDKSDTYIFNLIANRPEVDVTITNK